MVSEHWNVFGHSLGSASLQSPGFRSIFTVLCDAGRFPGESIVAPDPLWLGLGALHPVMIIALRRIACLVLVGIFSPIHLLVLSFYGIY